MPRFLKVAAAQVGAINRGEARDAVVARLIALVEKAAAENVKLVVFREPHDPLIDNRCRVSLSADSRAS